MSRKDRERALDDHLDCIALAERIQATNRDYLREIHRLQEAVFVLGDRLGLPTEVVVSLTDAARDGTEWPPPLAEGLGFLPARDATLT